MKTPCHGSSPEPLLESLEQDTCPVLVQRDHAQALDMRIEQDVLAVLADKYPGVPPCFVQVAGMTRRLLPPARSLRP